MAGYTSSLSTLKLDVRNLSLFTVFVLSINLVVVVVVVVVVTVLDFASKTVLASGIGVA